MSLLRADLRALANLPRDAAGRRLVAHLVVGLAMLAFLSWWIADNLLGRPELVELAHRRGGDSLLGTLGIGLLPCPVAATWLGLTAAQRQLFDSVELPLWQSAPIAPWRGALQILLRAGLLAVVWAGALSAPFVTAVLMRAGAPPLAYALLPLCVVAATLPLMATLLVVQLVLVRLFAGRALRLLLTVVGALASIGFLTWLLLVLFTGGERTDRFVAAAGAPESLPWTVHSSASLLAAAARGAFDTTALRTVAWWLLFTATALWIGARLHPRALEAHRLAEPPLLRRRTAWPAGIAAVFRRKEIAQLLQQPGALIGFLIFAVLVFALVENQVLVGGILANRRLPADVRHVCAMLLQWFLATVLVLYPHMGRLVLWDAAQWSLYRTSPAPAFAILRGKLEAVGLLLLWPLLLVGVGGAHALGAAPGTLLLFTAIALPGLLIALGTLALVGTLPWLVRPDEGRQVAQGGRNFFASLLLVLLFELALSPALVGWMWLSSWSRRNLLTADTVAAFTPWVVAGAWLGGLAALAVGVAVGGRNFRRLTLPQ